MCPPTPDGDITAPRTNPTVKAADTSSAVPIQTIRFSSDKKVPLVPTAQLAVTSSQYAGPNPSEATEGWVIDIHGNVTFTLQLAVVEAVQATFRIQAFRQPDPIGAVSSIDIPDPDDAVYDIVANGKVLSHRERCDAKRGWHSHAVVIPMDVLNVGANTIVLSVSDRGKTLGLESVTVQSGFSEG